MSEGMYTRLSTEVYGLMRLFLDCPDIVRRVIINGNQVSIVEFAKGYPGGITTRMLATEKDCSIQSASTQLIALWRRGYLNRHEVPDITGGIIYVYKSAV